MAFIPETSTSITGPICLPNMSWNTDLSSRAMEVIRSLDSRSFGFLDFQSPSSNPTTSDVSASTSFLSKDLIQQGIAKLRRDLEVGPQADAVKAELYCQIGHLHLLLEHYTEALSAYQQYQYLSPLESSRNANMYYGMGLIYFSSNSFNWALQSFREVLTLAPEFARRCEIHLRLGIMFKTKGDYNNSIQHFKQAANMSGPASFSKPEIQFHLGNIYHLQGHYIAAKETFEGILAKKNVANSIKAMALRQLGWLYHSVPEVAVMCENPSAKSVDLLKLAVGADPCSSQAWYLLGRCHASQGRARDAFVAYQQAVNHCTDNQAEIWCSIGILYHNMGQTKDSLQSYVCAVYLDPSRHEAWTDMGCLYESVSQPIDALITYKNAILIRSADQVNLDKTEQYLLSRVANLDQYIAMVSPAVLHSQPHILPTVKDAWHTMIPPHVRNTPKSSQSTYTPILDFSSLQVSPNSLTPPSTAPPVYGHHSSIVHHGPTPKKQRMSRHSNLPIVIRNMSDTWHPNPPPRGLEHVVGATPASVGPPTLEEHDILAHPNIFSVPDFPGFSGGDALSLNSNRPRPTSIGIKRAHFDSFTPAEMSSFRSDPSPNSSSTFTPISLTHGPNSFPTSFINSMTSPSTANYPQHVTPTATPISDLPGDLSSLSPLNGVKLSEEDFHEYLHTSGSQESMQKQAIGELLNSPNFEEKFSSQLPQYGNRLTGTVRKQQPPSIETVSGTHNETSPHSVPTAEENTLLSMIKPSHSCEANSDSSSGISSADANLQLDSNSIVLSPNGLLHSPYLEEDDLETLLDPIDEPFPSLASDSEYMVRDPDLVPPKLPPKDRKIDLHPEVAVFEVFTRDEALSETLHGLCCDPNTPVCMIRGLCPLMDIDLQLFSSKSIAKARPDHEMEVREQVQQASDKNYDPNSQKQIWRCESQRTHTTIKEYANYQKEVLQKQNGSDFKPSKKLIRFGTNIDLSDSDKWRPQLEELEKLPKFLRVNCPEANLLSHIDYSILGVNSAQLYMKVPGSRTPGHQENHNLCSVNINIGPGGCEWFSVHNKYWGAFHKLCDKHKICFLTGSWWPILEELEELNIPVYRFTQQPGDIVWLNPGTVHWVQANTVCNNIAWNVGPITAHQFRMAWERYMWNKIRNVRSIVPMIHLSWSLAKKVKIVDEALFLQLRSLLESSLAKTHRIMAHLEEALIPLTPHPRIPNETAPCCNNCLDEVFNILFVLNHKGEYLVYCHKCAMAMKKSFKVLRQFTVEELQHILDNFKLHPKSFCNSTAEVNSH